MAEESVTATSPPAQAVTPAILAVASGLRMDLDSARLLQSVAAAIATFDRDRRTIPRARFEVLTDEEQQRYVSAALLAVRHIDPLVENVALHRTAQALADVDAEDHFRERVPWELLPEKRQQHYSRLASRVIATWRAHMEAGR